MVNRAAGHLVGEPARIAKRKDFRRKACCAGEFHQLKDLALRTPSGDGGHLIDDKKDPFAFKGSIRPDRGFR